MQHLRYYLIDIPFIRISLLIYRNLKFVNIATHALPDHTQFSRYIQLILPCENSIERIKPHQTNKARTHIVHNIYFLQTLTISKGRSQHSNWHPRLPPLLEIHQRSISPGSAKARALSRGTSKKLINPRSRRSSFRQPDVYRKLSRSCGYTRVPPRSRNKARERAIARAPSNRPRIQSLRGLAVYDCVQGV